jgi:hypothetical protein
MSFFIGGSKGCGDVIIEAKDNSPELFLNEAATRCFIA